ATACCSRPKGPSNESAASPRALRRPAPEGRHAVHEPPQFPGRGDQADSCADLSKRPIVIIGVVASIRRRLVAPANETPAPAALFARCAHRVFVIVAARLPREQLL